MKDNSLLGGVKFYRNADFLDGLLNACCHCTPAEVYSLGDIDIVAVSEQDFTRSHFSVCEHCYGWTGRRLCWGAE